MSDPRHDLRQRAEQRLARTREASPVDAADLQRLVHELRVHQIELEMQNEELQAAKDVAEAANRAKGAFLANISHEIRTPLNTILSLAQTLKRTTNPEQAQRLDRMNEAGKHLVAILDDILDLARIEAGRLQLSVTDFNPHAVLETVHGMIADTTAAKGLRLGIETDGVPTRLVGDPLRLRQALLNYAGNAVKFTERGGIILRAVLVREEAQAVWLRFEVRDTGIGMDAATRERLFRPFEQGDAAITRIHGGTGLGLSLVKRLTGLMGGDVGVDSQVGRGSLFQCDFGGRRILLVDDDRLSRYGGALLLRELGFKVEVAEDGDQALASFAAAPPDLVLMDLCMWAMDGLEATRQIRALPTGRSVPIVALTANAFSEDREASLAAGMDDFIAKPMDYETLAAVLLRQFRRYQAKADGSTDEILPVRPDPGKML